MASVLILGGGFGGLAAARELRARLSEDDEVTVVAADDHFYVGFAKLWDWSARDRSSRGQRAFRP